jgi:SAM-dependent methyltransferase
MSTSKDAVRDFWDQASCGERLYLDGVDGDAFRRQAASRYALEPYIAPFADFAAAKGKRVLEIGVGLGADHQRFAEAGAVLSGIDLTPRAVEITRRRFAALALETNLRVGDAERLAFADDTFDVVYSWGVIHHSPDTPTAVAEIFRVLRPGGEAKVMVYHTYSLVGVMLWLRYGLARGRPLTPLRGIYANYLESPGTKAYTVGEARALFGRFADLRITTQLTHGDLLASGAGQRHGGVLLDAARTLWPRWLFKSLFPTLGLFMLIQATKPS